MRARSPTSSRFIASLKVPSTITTTLAPTSSERILVVRGEDGLAPSLAPTLMLSLALAASFAASLAFALAAARPALSLAGCAAAAAWAARRAAAMKLEDDTGSFGADGISLIALSDAAMRSLGEDMRPPGRVPGSSGSSGGNSGASAGGRGADVGTRISLIASGGGVTTAGAATGPAA